MPQVTGDNLTLEGTIPPSLNEESLTWPLLVRGGVVDGQQLSFREIIGQPSAPPPDAVLRIRFDNVGSGVPIVGLSPIQFDASSSRGDGLTYVMEYGDGAVTAEPTTTHRIDREPARIRPLDIRTRLSVVDRFGRVDSEEQEFSTFGLANGAFLEGWYSSDGTLTLSFGRRSGVTYEGSVTIPALGM